MPVLLTAFTRALRSLLTPPMMGLMAFALVATILGLAGFVASCSLLSASLLGHTHAAYGVGAALLWLGASTGAALMAWFLFPGIMPVIVCFFDRRIARIIELQDYPDAAPRLPSAFGPEFRHDVRFSLLTLLLNLMLPFVFMLLLPIMGILLLPVIYLMPFLIYPAFMTLFYLLNGYLLGRQFFIMAARQHIPIAEAEALRKQHRRTILLAGIALMFLATLPLINLVAPFWGIAVMVHLYHRIAPVTLLRPATPEPKILV